MNVYAGRRAILTTMHGKDVAVAPPFAEILELGIVISHGVDTDLLGTFTGEVARSGAMLEVAVRKARLGMAKSGLALGVSSEGSFGPHPGLPFVAGGIELMAFVDDERGIVIDQLLVTDCTNFSHRRVRAANDIENFLSAVGFPDHALIVRPYATPNLPPIKKGIQSRPVLESAIRDAIDASPEREALVETDMRAHLNPTRMKTIRELSYRLAARLRSQCPSCSMPGWGRVDVSGALPCELCETPTDLPASEVFGCVSCDAREILARGDGMTSAPSSLCGICNP